MRRIALTRGAVWAGWRATAATPGSHAIFLTSGRIQSRVAQYRLCDAYRRDRRWLTVFAAAPDANLLDLNNSAAGIKSRYCEIELTC